MRRIVKPTVDLKEIAIRVRPSEKQHWMEFLNRRNQYLQKFELYPAQSPNIDWDYYRNKINPKNVAALEKFKASYEQFQVPYPTDNYTASIEAEKKKFKEEMKKFIAESMERIKEYKCLKDYFEDMLPYEELTCEEFHELFPDRAPNFAESMWPHEDEDQIWYVDETPKHDKGNH